MTSVFFLFSLLCLFLFPTSWFPLIWLNFMITLFSPNLSLKINTYAILGSYRVSVWVLPVVWWCFFNLLSPYKRCFQILIIFKHVSVKPAFTGIAHLPPPMTKACLFHPLTTMVIFPLSVNFPKFFFFHFCHIFLCSPQIHLFEFDQWPCVDYYRSESCPFGSIVKNSFLNGWIMSPKVTGI